MYTVYTTNDCTFCTKTKTLLKEYNCEYINIILDTPDKKKDFKETTGLKTVPQIYTDHGIHIGGYDELIKHMHRKLDENVSIMENHRQANRFTDNKVELIKAKKLKLALKDKIGVM